MGFFSFRAICDDCGKEVGLRRFKTANGWLCSACLKLRVNRPGTSSDIPAIADTGVVTEEDEPALPGQSEQSTGSIPSRLADYWNTANAGISRNTSLVISIVAALALLGAAQQSLRKDNPAAIDQRNTRVEISSGNAASALRSTVTGTQSYDEWLRTMVERRTGARSSLGVARVRGITFDERNEAFPILMLVADDNSTPKLARLGMLFSATKLFQGIFADNRANTAMVVWMLPLTDQYGNTSMEAVMAIRVSRTTAGKVNWKNFSYENLPSIADDFVEIPMSQW